VLSGFFFTIHFVTSSLIHIRQKEKIALEIAAKVASVNGPLQRTYKPRAPAKIRREMPVEVVERDNFPRNDTALLAKKIVRLRRCASMK
jgi:hypothetical protein